MNWEDTVMSDDDLCDLVCFEHRANTGEGKNCDGLDCNQCGLDKQAEISLNAYRKEIVILLARHHFGTLPDGRDTFVFTREELLKLENGG